MRRDWAAQWRSDDPMGRDSVIARASTSITDREVTASIRFDVREVSFEFCTDVPEVLDVQRCRS